MVLSHICTQVGYILTSQIMQGPSSLHALLLSLSVIQAMQGSLQVLPASSEHAVKSMMKLLLP